MPWSISHQIKTSSSTSRLWDRWLEIKYYQLRPFSSSYLSFSSPKLKSLSMASCKWSTVLMVKIRPLHRCLARGPTRLLWQAHRHKRTRVDPSTCPSNLSPHPTVRLRLYASLLPLRCRANLCIVSLLKIRSNTNSSIFRRSNCNSIRKFN